MDEVDEELSGYSARKLAVNISRIENGEQLAYLVYLSERGETFQGQVMKNLGDELLGKRYGDSLC